MRLHSSCNEFTGKEPWKFSLETHAIMNDFMRLRHRMIPYLYSMNYLASEGRPLISPMYYDYPDEWDAYAVKNQYYFGTELIVAPITSKCIEGVNRAKVKVWLPKGTYFDIFSDTVYSGDRFINMYRDKSTMPVLAKAGGILPLTNEIFGQDFLNNPRDLVLFVYPGADNEFDLYEDDGETLGYKHGQFAITKLINDNSKCEFVIKKPQGDIGVLPESRNIKLHFLATNDNKATVYVGDKTVEVLQAYDESSHTFVVEIKEWDYSDDIKVCLEKKHDIRRNDVQAAVYEILNTAEISYIEKEDVYRPIMAGRSKAYIISELSGRNINVDVRDAVIEQVLAYID
jgi:alpha-glucosidase (family GH31 glycosyl hydrolase)